MVVAEKVQSQWNSVMQPVGSPSLIAGKCALRMGSKVNTVMPSPIASSAPATSFHRRMVCHRRASTATPTAGITRKPAGWFV